MTEEGEEELLREKWLRVLFHIQDKHKWRTGKRIKKRCHCGQTKKEFKATDWLNAYSGPFKVSLNTVTVLLNTLKDLKYHTKFSDRNFGNISLALQQMGSKKPIFFLTKLIMRSQLAMMDFNKNSELEQTTTKKQKKRYNICLSKVTKSW